MKETNQHGLGSDALADLLSTSAGRRRLRQTLLPVLPSAEAYQLVVQLLAFPADLSPWRRDQTTRHLVDHAKLPILLQHVELLAESNAALALWQRLAQEGLSILVTAALRVLRKGSLLAREVVLALLLADPDPVVELSSWAKELCLPWHWLNQTQTS